MATNHLISQERQQHVLSLLRAKWPQLVLSVGPEARLLYTVGALVASDAGVVKRRALDRAAQDQELVNLALKLMATAAATVR